MKSTLKCSVGDVICVECSDGFHEFRIKGFVQEPSQGSSSIGWKQVFISREDYARILASCRVVDKEMSFESEVTVMMIYKAPDCILSDAKFQRQLNLDTKIVANSIGSLTKAQSLRYTGLMFDVLSNVLFLFVGFCSSLP